MDNFEIDRALRSMTLLVDTREQDTESLHKRLQDAGMPYKRTKLDFGDYSCELTLDSGETFSLANRAVVERKMSLDELASCFTTQRKRFEAEFERAKTAGARIYLLVEGGELVKIHKHAYRSQIHPNALRASIFAFLARYDCRYIPCKAEHSGMLIREIMTREAKETLKDYETQTIR